MRKGFIPLIFGAVVLAACAFVLDPTLTAAKSGDSDEIVMFDQYGKMSKKDQKGRLDNVLAELRNNPSNIALIILRSKEGSTEKHLLKRVKFIKDHIFTYRKFPVNRVVIVSDSYPSSSDSVKITKSLLA